jgi:transposase
VIDLGIKGLVVLENQHNLPFLKSAAKSLQLENARLRAEVASANEVKTKLAELEARHAELERQSGERIAELQDEVARLGREMQLLQELLDLRNRALFGRSSERRELTAEEAAAEAAAKPEKKPRKKQKGHGPTAQPKLAIVVKDTHTLVGDALKCTACGGQLTPMGTAAEEAELIGIEKRRIVLEKHLRTMYSCSCGGCLKTAAGPLKLIPGGRYSLGFTIAVAFLKYFAHVPLHRQVQMMKHEDAHITTAALCDQLDALATALKATYEAIWKVLQAEPVLRADETPWAVMSNGHNENERFYAWVAVGSLYVAFRLLDTRSKEGAASILGSFAGKLMVDGLTSYPAAAKGKPGEPLRFKVANCMTHARRPFIECEKYYPVECGFAIGLFRKLYAVERAGKVAGADLGKLRDEKSRPLMDELFAWAKVQQAQPHLLPSSGLAKALGYLVNHEAGLRVFLDDPAVPADNNESEQAVRGLVLGRVNFYGSRSRDATEVAAILYTLVESAKRCGVSPEAYLLAAAETALSKAGAVLLPDEFKRQLDAVRGPPAQSA